MSSKLKCLLISVGVSLIVLISPFLISCTGQIGDTSSDNVVVTVGDVMLSRQVGEIIKIKGDPKAPFLKTAEILEEADITFCNLESPFYDEEPPIEGEMIFGADPDF